MLTKELVDVAFDYTRLPSPKLTNNKDFVQALPFTLKMERKCENTTMFMLKLDDLTLWIHNSPSIPFMI